VTVQIAFQHLYTFATPAFSTEMTEQVSSIQKRLLDLKRRLQSSRNRESVRLADRLNYLASRTTEYFQED
jgi:hypothetical protein